MPRPAAGQLYTRAGLSARVLGKSAVIGIAMEFEQTPFKGGIGVKVAADPLTGDREMGM
mgnify:CR=1 FL=1